MRTYQVKLIVNVVTIASLLIGGIGLAKSWIYPNDCLKMFCGDQTPTIIFVIGIVLPILFYGGKTLFKYLFPEKK